MADYFSILLYSCYNASTTWPSISLSSSVSVTVRVRRGHLVAVVGMVGSGKSSLLSALLGEMNIIRGHVNVQVCMSLEYMYSQVYVLGYNDVFGT